MSDAKSLQRTLKMLFESQPDDQRLRDHLEGVARDEHFSGLTWYWGPILYRRNRAMFRSLILQNFASWEIVRSSWRRIPWARHQAELEGWLRSTRANRDVHLSRQLLSWKYSQRKWGAVDSKAWNAALLSDYQSAGSAAARATVLEEYDGWFELEESVAVALYQQDRSCAPFLLRRLPRTTNFWGTSDGNRAVWERLTAAAIAAGDEELRWELYRRQVPVAQWRGDVLELAQIETDPERLCAELQRRHPAGYGLKLSPTMLELLTKRGRDVMPYARERLQDLGGGWYGESLGGVIKLAKERGWWDLWSAAIRQQYNDAPFNTAVEELLKDTTIRETDRMERLKALAGVSREWNWPGIGFARVHGLKDELATRLYERYPELAHGPFKPHITPTWWQGYPLLLAAAKHAGDKDLIDLIASRYATRVDYAFHRLVTKERNALLDTAHGLTKYYQVIRDTDEEEFARRAANVLTRIPAFAIPDANRLLKTNPLARLLFVRSFAAFLTIPAAVRDLVEGSDIHVQQLAYRILAQTDPRARRMAAESLDILIGTLLRPLHRRTRLAAFEALANAARHDEDSARRVLTTARSALRLPDKRYPKEELIGLVGQVLHAQPELREAEEQPVIYGLAEVTS